MITNSLGFKYRRFQTLEEIICRRDKTVEPYFNVKNWLCRDVLKIAAEAKDLFPLVQAFFPVVRTAVSFQVPLAPSKIPAWLTIAFYAGAEFGHCHPDAGAKLLAGCCRETEIFIRHANLAGALKHAPPTPEGLQNAYALIWRKYQPNSKLRIAPALLHAFVDGLAVAIPMDLKTAPALAKARYDFTNPRSILFARAIISSAASNHNVPVVDRLAHPLLRAADAKYQNSPAELALIEPFLNRRLGRLKVTSEFECPSGDLDLVEWVASALEYGRKLRSNRMLMNLLRVFGAGELTAWSRGWGWLLAARRSATHAETTKVLLEWHEELYGWRSGDVIPYALTRIVQLADRAIWIGMFEEMIR